MTRNRLRATTWGLFVAAAVSAHAGMAFGADLTLTVGGRVSVELLTADAAYRNTMSLSSPTARVETRGCKLEAANGLPGEHLVSEKVAQRGCRIDLDADPSTPGIQAFAAGTTLQFAMCAQFNSDDNCEYVWRSDPASNSDSFDHLRTTAIHATDFPGQIYQLAWEDKENGGDKDFNDLIAIVRISKDTDGDGLWDDWEKLGIDTDGDGTVDLDLPALGANVNHKDVFMEIDYMDCNVAGGDCATGDTHSHRPKQAAIDAVVDAFKNANVRNPDGFDGISLHIDVSNSMPHRNATDLGCFGGNDFDVLKSDPANFGPANPRRFAYHYSMWAHQQTLATTSSGCGEVGGNDFMVTLGGWEAWGAAADVDVGTVQQQAGSLIHEFGHNLGMNHGGADDINYKPNYMGNMNYRFQFGVPPTDPDGAGPLTGRVDYSRSVLAQLDELSLDEAAGVGAGSDNSFFYCPDFSDGTIVGNEAANWNCTGENNETGVIADINGDRICVDAGQNGTLETTPAAGSDDVVLGNRIVDGPDRTCQTAPVAGSDDTASRPVNGVQPRLLIGQDDWNNLKFAFQAMVSFEDGDMSARPLNHQSVDVGLYETKLAAELSISIAPPAATVSATQVTLMVVAQNNRPVGASDVTVSIVLPSGLNFVSCAATNAGQCGGTAGNPVVTFAGLGGGEKATISIVGAVDCSVVDGTSLPVTAQIAHSRPDPVPGNDAVTVQLSVPGRSQVDKMMGFEDVSLWHSNETTLALSSRTQTQGCHAIDVPGQGYRVAVDSPAFSTPLAGTTSNLALDLFIPSDQPNPYYLGAVQMYASCPSAYMNNAYIGQVELTGKPIGAFSTITFAIPTYIGSTLMAVNSDCYFSIAVNMNQAPTSPTLDNLRFTP